MDIIELDHDVTTEELQEMARKAIKIQIKIDLAKRNKERALQGYVEIKVSDFN